MIEQTSGYVVYDETDVNAQKLDFSKTTTKPIRVNQTGWYSEDGAFSPFPELHLQVPGNHLLFDAKLAFVVGKLVGLDDGYITEKLESYAGCWRRSEIIRTTKHGNILMSDYGHHPTEILLTLEAIAEKYPERELCVVFQPHQHSRTRELLREFATCFDAAQKLIISNIYFSRDSEEDVQYMTTERFVDTLYVRYPLVQNGEGLENTIELIKKYDRENPNNSIIVLL
jgi:UDP-N-acetylmuramate--alanine ligase